MSGSVRVAAHSLGRRTAAGCAALVAYLPYSDSRYAGRPYTKSDRGSVELAFPTSAHARAFYLHLVASGEVEWVELYQSSGDHPFGRRLSDQWAVQS